MNAAMTEKIQMLDEYIDKLEEAISDNNISVAEYLQREIIATFDGEIPNLCRELDNYSLAGFYGRDNPVDFIGDAKLLKSKLRNYKLNLGAHLIQPFTDGNGSVQVTQTVQQDVKNTITITLEQTIKNINDLSSDSLSDEDKEILCGKLATLSTEKSKESKWEKAKGILKWIADKSVDVGIATLPYLIEALNAG